MPDDTVAKNENNTIILSQHTQALLDTFKTAKKRTRPDDISALSVSQTVSFFALVYEKVRNAVEYREDHLILRASIERILRRRFSLNPDGHGEAENLLRELLWARYFDNGVLGAEDNMIIQNLVNKYILLRRQLVVGRDSELRIFLDQFLMDLLTCEIEETLKPESAQIQANLTFFLYQVLRKKIKIEGLSEEQKDSFFLVAIEKVFGKSDRSYLRYHLFVTFYKPFFTYSKKDLETIANKLPTIFKKIDDIILYGSMARGEFRINSDIDLLIVAEDDFENESDVRKMCNHKNIRKKIKNDIKPTFVTQKEIELGRSKSSDYYENIYKEGLRLI